MEQIFDQLIRDCNAYRTAVDRILSTEVVNPNDWQNCLFNAQICAVRLQLDRLIVIQKAAIMETLPKRSESQMLPRSHAEREMRLREQIKDRFVTSAAWGHFKTGNPMAELFGLVSCQDYIQNFTLHLPEIYEATFVIEQTAQLFVDNPDDFVLTHLITALQHIGQNHINFLQPALDWASDVDFWD